MGWKPLPDDVPLDHETLTAPEPAPTVADASAPAVDPVDPAPAAATAPPNLTELPPGAQLDGEGPPQPPAVSATPLPTQGVNVSPTVTEQGFADTMAGDDQKHASLSPKQQKQYESFFADPRKPPAAEALRKWYHEQTGAYLNNADAVVDYFKRTGQFSTNQEFVLPTKEHGAEESFFSHAANAGGFDWAPEIVAPLNAVGLGGGDRPNVFNSDASFPQLMGINADIDRGQLAQDSAQHPIASVAGEAAGALATAPVGGAAADVARLGKAGEMGKAAIQALGEGAAFGSGAAGPGHRGEGAAVGAALAPAVAVGLKVPSAGYRAVRSVLETAPSAARRIVAKAIQDDANTPASVGQDIAEAHANQVPMALGDTGENMRGLLAASSRKSGMGRTVARDALEGRQAELADRVVSHIERDLGPIANPHTLADSMMTKARDTAAPLYDAAYARPGAAEFAQKVAPLLQRPSMSKALAYAYRVAKEEGRDSEELGLAVSSNRTTSILDANGNHITVPEVTMAKNPTWQTLDYVKRGADDLVESYKNKTTGRYEFDTEGKAANNTLRSFISMFDTANPDYEAARAAYGGEVKGITAMNDGRKSLNLTADDLEAKMRGMSSYEKEMYALGARRAMAELVRTKGDTADVVHALVGTGKKRAMMGRLFGDRKGFQRFVETLSQEKEGWRTFKQALLGSPTAANHADDAALEAMTTGAEMVAHGGIPVTTAIRKISQLFGRQLSEKTHQQIAALLSNTDPAALRELAAELQKRAVQRGFRMKVGKAVRGATGKGVVAAQAEQAQ